MEEYLSYMVLMNGDFRRLAVTESAQEMYLASFGLIAVAVGTSVPGILGYFMSGMRCGFLSWQR